MFKEINNNLTRPHGMDCYCQVWAQAKLKTCKKECKHLVHFLDSLEVTLAQFFQLQSQWIRAKCLNHPLLFPCLCFVFGGGGDPLRCLRYVGSQKGFRIPRKQAHCNLEVRLRHRRPLPNYIFFFKKKMKSIPVKSNNRLKRFRQCTKQNTIK